MSTWLTPACQVFRWYLRKFPLRDGKAWLYARLAPALTPPERFRAVNLDAGFRLNLDLRDEAQRKIYFYGDYDERYEAGMIRRVLAPGELFWDVGANIGYYTLLAAAALNHSGQVAAFEPGREAYTRLQENLSLNPYRNIATYNLAVTDRDGEATLFSSSGTADGCASLYAGGMAARNRETCRTVALDGFRRSQGLPGPDFIKIDVEGAELLVLEGARNILDDLKPLLLLEMKEATLTAAGTSKAAIQEFLAARGYVPAFPYRRQWYRGGDVAAIKSRNILWFDPAKAAHRQKLASLPLLGTD